MNIKEAIEILNNEIKDPKFGLPDDIFLFISKNVPLVNVDLLIKNEKNQILLSWREDEYGGIGWHIPGRIKRFREETKRSVFQLLLKELNFDIQNHRYKFLEKPLNYGEYITNNKDNIRGHFISFLYECKLFNYNIKNIQDSLYPGYLKWFNKCPDNLVKSQNHYRKFLKFNLINDKIIKIGSLVKNKSNYISGYLPEQDIFIVDYISDNGKLFGIKGIPEKDFSIHFFEVIKY